MIKISTLMETDRSNAPKKLIQGNVGQGSSGSFNSEAELKMRSGEGIMNHSSLSN